MSEISPGILPRKMFEILRIQVSRGEVDPKSSQMILHSVQTRKESNDSGGPKAVL